MGGWRRRSSTRCRSVGALGLRTCARLEDRFLLASLSFEHTTGGTRSDISSAQPSTWSAGGGVLMAALRFVFGQAAFGGLTAAAVPGLVE